MSTPGMKIGGSFPTLGSLAGSDPFPMKDSKSVEARLTDLEQRVSALEAASGKTDDDAGLSPTQD